MKKLLAAVAIVLAQVGVATAATMTFDNYDFANADFRSRTYIESEITATGNAPLVEAFGRGGGDSVYIADGGWGGPNFLTFSMASLFDAVSFDLTPSIFNYFVASSALGAKKGEGVRSSFVNVRVQGYDADGLKAVTSFNMGSVLEAKTYTLGSAFADLTSLVIGFEPFAGFGAVTELGPNRFGACTDSPCSRYRLDNVNLAPVPLPATLSLMMVALAGIGVAARRRRATVAV
jgi:PEP-CTERM motif